MDTNPLFSRDITSVKQVDVSWIAAIDDMTRLIGERTAAGMPLDILRGKVLTALFYEPSSRTFASFVAAVQRLGGGFIPLHGVSSSSVAKGESFEDTVRTFGNLSDCIVLRHPDEGASARAADLCDIPVLNAGDGGGEHPTQAILELVTIRRHVADIGSGTITVIGDLLYGRTIHSLVYILSLYPGLKLTLVSPPQLRMPEHIVAYAREHGVQVTETDSPVDYLGQSDVLYVNRIKKERFTDMDQYEKLRDWYRITPETMRSVRPDAILMHPLPRADEIDPAVDSDPRAVYLREQMTVMVEVRMAILSLVLTRKPWERLA